MGILLPQASLFLFVLFDSCYFLLPLILVLSNSFCSCYIVLLHASYGGRALFTYSRCIINDIVLAYFSIEKYHVFPEDEVDANGFLLLQGSIEILSGRQESLEILNAGPTGLWFGDEQLFCYSKRQITAKTHTPCIIATFSAESFQVSSVMLFP